MQATLNEPLEGMTAMVIAHRLSTIRSANQLLVFADGAIVERGPHEELLAAGGRHEELHRTQFTVQRPRPKRMRWVGSSRGGRQAGSPRQFSKTHDPLTSGAAEKPAVK